MKDLIFLLSPLFFSFAYSQPASPQWEKIPLAFNENASGYAVLAMTVYNDVLYIGGNFRDSVTKKYAPLIRVEDHTKVMKIYVDLPDYDRTTNGGNSVVCMTSYHNKLYAVMYSRQGVEPRKYGILEYDGKKWKVFAEYAFRPFAMVFFRDTLYMAAQKNPNTYTDDVFKWDGTKWIPLNIVTHAKGAQVRSLLVYQDALYAAGGFYEEDTINNSPPVTDTVRSSVAIWNGRQWNSMGGIKMIPYDIELHNGMFYVGCIDFPFNTNSHPWRFVYTWVGNKWIETGDPDMVGVVQLFSHPTGLYAICQTPTVMKSDGVSWGGLSAQTFNDRINVGEIYKGYLYIGGDFTKIGDTAAYLYAKIKIDNESYPPAPQFYPVAHNDTVKAKENVDRYIFVKGNDEYDGPDTGTVYLYLPPINGTAEISPSGGGSVHYFPAKDFDGQDSLAYRLCNYQNNCDTAWVQITIEPKAQPNKPPVAKDDAYTVTMNKTEILTIRANDNDPDGDPLNTSIVISPPNGTPQVLPSGNIQYTPVTNFIGKDSLLYQVCDDEQACAKAWVRITVVQDSGVFVRSNSTVPGIHLYPNPADDYLSISTSGNSAASRYLITDMIGRTIGEGGLSSEVISLSGMEEGTYIIYLMANSQILTPHLFLVAR